jgi:hypothetical protein
VANEGTSHLLGALITYLLSFSPASGATITSTLGGRLYAIRPPDNASYPHGVLRLTGREESGDDSSNREDGRIELQLFGRPLIQSVAVEYAADVAEQAFRKYGADHYGRFDVRSRVTRDTLPPPPAPGDREIAHVRVLWRYTWWPTYRTQYAIAAGDAP